MERIFGTDGIRGRAGEGWLALPAVAALGRVLGRVMEEETRGGPRSVLLAHDGRRSGPSIEAALAHGLTQSGFSPRSVGLCTTPGLAWLTRDEEFAFGAMVSASHNAAADNGIKVFARGGEKLSDAVELEIERALREEQQEGVQPRAVEHDPALEVAYMNHLLEAGAGDLVLDGVVIAVDCANGGGSRVGPRVFGRLGAQVHALAAEPDGENINRDCGSTSPEALQREVRSRRARLGVALDGDGDRCILVDEKGSVVNGDGILTVLARQAKASGRLADPRVVATVMSNRGLHRALREVGVGVLEVGVGDRQVVESMRSEALALGGEQSGHIVLGDENAYIGDGLFTALRVLRAMREAGGPLSALVAPYRPYPQVLLNVPVTHKPSLVELPRVRELVQRIETELGQDGRVLVRYSGTEPLARVMVEGPELSGIQARAHELASAIEREIGS